MKNKKQKENKDFNENIRHRGGGEMGQAHPSTPMQMENIFISLYDYTHKHKTITRMHLTHTYTHSHSHTLKHTWKNEKKPKPFKKRS